MPPEKDIDKVIDKVHKDLSEQLGLNYFTRYEHARTLSVAHRTSEAVKVFKDLYLDAFQEGALPPIDAAFINALQESNQDGGDNPLAGFLHERLRDLLKDARFYTATLLVWQTWQLNQKTLADELFQRILASAPAQYKTAVQMIGLEYLLQTGRFDRADTLLQQILTDPVVAKSATSWRISADLAQKNGHLARAAAALEKALDLEFKDLPEVINLASLRDDYRRLLNYYQQVATAVTILEMGSPKELLTKVVKAADRWRSLDPDNAEACHLTGRILRTMGAKNLAWDYLTTPIGMKPNDSAAWVGLAETLRQDADYDLADRAFALAFDAEPTNAEILWKRAQNLEQLSRYGEASTLYQQIVAGTWQPRFQAIQQQARWQLNNR